MVGKVLKYGSGVLLAALIVAQFIQPERTNPPADPSASFEAVAKPPREVAAVIGRACRDCHSNQTVWPWYSRISPASWLVAGDVKEGRAKLNFSQWNIYGQEMTRIKLGEICQEVKKGEMPPSYYLPMHPDTKVTPAEVSAICSTPVGQASWPVYPSAARTSRTEGHLRAGFPAPRNRQDFGRTTLAIVSVSRQKNGLMAPSAHTPHFTPAAAPPASRSTSE